ncbi:hypothetical protein R3P38DRAFT_2703867 [Favolaschia claudopus]|uniref:Golgi apparatus membrane protein TVP38 n=1 Tax=Favolaschia claudopus TaxID=2862362 RepID=A0AAW0BNC5_9AGAR
MSLMSHNESTTNSALALEPIDKAGSSKNDIPLTVTIVEVPSCGEASPSTPDATEAELNYLHGVRRKRSIWYWLRAIVPALIVFTALLLISILREKIVDGLEPLTDWIKDNNPAGAAIIIGAMIIVSFPPLIGHEILAVLCGVSFEFGEACLVDALGTVLGEVASFFVFRYACTARGRKLEESKIEYGALAHIVRRKDGQIWILLVMRYSAIPAHLSTPLFAAVGVPFYKFLLAVVLALPKSLVPVFVGWSARPENEGNNIANIISKVVLAIGLCITFIALWWIRRRMNKDKENYIHSRRKARQEKNKGPVYVAP